MDNLDTTNPNHLTFKHDLLELAVLGGIRLEGVDRMRVTLKIQVKHLSLRHNLDLYNDNQVEKLVPLRVTTRKAGERADSEESRLGVYLIHANTSCTCQ